MNVAQCCGHPPHVGVCGHPITEDVRVARYPYDTRGEYYRTLVVDDCPCEVYQKRGPDGEPVDVELKPDWPAGWEPIICGCGELVGGCRPGTWVRIEHACGRTVEIRPHTGNSSLPS